MVGVPPGMRCGLGRPRRWLGGGCRRHRAHARETSAWAAIL